MSGFLEADGTITIAAASQEVGSLADALARGEAAIDLPESESERAGVVYVRRESDPGVEVTIEGDAIVVSGSVDAIALLAANIGQLARTPSQFGGHVHFEYFPGHPYLRPGTVPLVVIATEGDR